MTDFQLVDEESPARVELVDRYGGSVSAAYRPQEGLLPFIVEQSVQQLRARAASSTGAGSSSWSSPATTSTTRSSTRRGGTSTSSTAASSSTRTRALIRAAAACRTAARCITACAAAASTTSPTAVAAGPTDRVHAESGDERSHVRPAERRPRPLRSLRADEPAVPRDRARHPLVLGLRQPRRARPGQRPEQHPLRAGVDRLRQAGAALTRGLAEAQALVAVGSPTRSARASSRSSSATSWRRCSARS